MRMVSADLRFGVGEFVRCISVPEPAQVGEVACQPVRPVTPAKRPRGSCAEASRRGRPATWATWHPRRSRGRSALGAGHHENRGRADVSAALVLVRRGGGPIHPPRGAGTAGESQHAQHEQTNQRCSSHGVSSRLDLVHLPSMGPESLRIRVPAKFHRHGGPRSSGQFVPELEARVDTIPSFKRTFHLPHPAQCEQ